MCPQCRSLNPAAATACGECATPLAARPRTARTAGASAAPLAGRILLTANCAVYVLMVAVAGFGSGSGGGAGGLLGIGGFDTAILVRFGLGRPGLIIGEGEYFRLLTPIFIHAGILHLLFNCMALVQVAGIIEGEYGARKTWIAYAFSGLVGGLASNFLRPILSGQAIGYVGASGAIFGLIGLALVHGWMRGGEYGRALSRAMLQWSLTILAIGWLAGFDNYAHAGGLVGGALFAAIIPSGRPQGRAASLLWTGLTVAAIAAFILAFFVAGLRGADALG
jgi:rhomboid protease GluP